MKLHKPRGSHSKCRNFFIFWFFFFFFFFVLQISLFNCTSESSIIQFNQNFRFVIELLCTLGSDVQKCSSNTSRLDAGRPFSINNRVFELIYRLLVLVVRLLNSFTQLPVSKCQFAVFFLLCPVPPMCTSLSSY